MIARHRDKRRGRGDRATPPRNMRRPLRDDVDNLLRAINSARSLCLHRARDITVRTVSNAQRRAVLRPRGTIRRPITLLF